MWHLHPSKESWQWPSTNNFQMESFSANLHCTYSATATSAFCHLLVTLWFPKAFLENKCCSILRRYIDILASEPELIQRKLDQIENGN